MRGFVAVDQRRELVLGFAERHLVHEYCPHAHPVAGCRRHRAPPPPKRLVPERRTVRSRCRALFNEDHRSVPDGLDDLASLGRTLHRRRADVLACVDHRASNGPTAAINARLEALPRHALRFGNPTPTGSRHCRTAATSPARSRHSRTGRARTAAPWGHGHRAGTR
ncbi:transposase [Rhodococcus aetherivorans]|uniref:transposase n=1 Tax=Rhodococcus aetherivorans TaxID=191292 RepID=UPI00374FA257